MINADKPLPKNHPSVRRFKRLLQSIKAKCPDAKKTGDAGLGNLVVRTQSVLKRKGIKVGLLQLMTWLDKSIPPAAKVQVRITDVATMFVAVATSPEWDGAIDEVHIGVRDFLIELSRGSNSRKKRK